VAFPQVEKLCGQGQDRTVDLPLFGWPHQPRQPPRLRSGPRVPARRPKTGRRPPTWSTTHPATLAARPGMTHRDERNVLRRTKPLPADYGRLRAGPPALTVARRWSWSGHCCVGTRTGRGRVRSPAGGGRTGWFGRRAGQGRCPARLPGQECCCGLTRWVTRC